MTSVDQLISTLTDQHRHIKDVMETVVSQEGSDRQAAFAELCGFLAAHEAAEEECIHAPAKEELGPDATIVDQRMEEEDEAGKAIAELERLGTESPEFRDKFENFRRAVIAHAEAEEHQELPKLSGTVDEVEITRMQQALLRVPELAASGGGSASFKDQLEAARKQFRSTSTTPR